MFRKIDRVTILKILIILLIINYMIIVIILKDNIILKFSRDVILIGLLALSFRDGKICKDYIWWVVFAVFAIMGFLRGDSVSMGIMTLRKYFFPVIALIVCEKTEIYTKENLSRILNFVLRFSALTGAWGIFQAWVLKDTFLINIGYPAQYFGVYQKVMLKSSFYFGNVGVQRVASTMSNSNVYAIVLGCTLLISLLLYKFITCNFKNIYIGIVVFAYLLTISRSNIIAFVITFMLYMFRYIPKVKILPYILVGIIMLIGVFIWQGEEGFLYKITDWINRTLEGGDASSAARPQIWAMAIEGIKANPFGIGMGHVGAMAVNNAAKNIYICENSYFALALDCGILGSVMYYVNIFINIFRFDEYKNILKDEESVRMARCGKGLLIYMLIVMFFSNHIYDMEAVAIVFIYVGILKNILNVAVENKLKDKAYVSCKDNKEPWVYRIY